MSGRAWFVYVRLAAGRDSTGPRGAYRTIEPACLRRLSDRVVGAVGCYDIEIPRCFSNELCCGK